VSALRCAKAQRIQPQNGEEVQHAGRRYARRVSKDGGSNRPAAMVNFERAARNNQELIQRAALMSYGRCHKCPSGERREGVEPMRGRRHITYKAAGEKSQCRVTGCRLLHHAYSRTRYSERISQCRQVTPVRHSRQVCYVGLYHT